MMAVTLLNLWRCSNLFLVTCCLVLNVYLKQLGAECSLTLTRLSPVLCPGHQILMTCNTSTHLQQWNIVDPNTGMTHTRVIELPSTSRPDIIPLEVQSFTFSFHVISALSTLPLISTLTVSDVTDYLNTSRISCLEIVSGKSEMVNVHIIEPNSALESMHVEYHLVGPRFGINNATVTIQFNESSQEYNYYGSLLSYNVTSPSQVEIQTQEKTTFQLVIPYNTQVNVSITARLCGQHSIPNVVQLFYTNCGHPPVQRSNMEIINPLSDIQDVMPVMEGFVVSFSCRSEFILSGPKSSTCMSNGEWEPDPREVECRQKVNCGPLSTSQHGHVHPFTSTLEGTEVVFSCSNSIKVNETNLTSICSGSGEWSPNPRDTCVYPYSECSNPGMKISAGKSDVLVGVIASSVTFALTTVLCFIIGFISGRVSTNLTKCAKLSRGESVNSNTADCNMATNPVYEDIMPQEMRPREKDPELKENLAYKPILLETMH